MTRRLLKLMEERARDGNDRWMIAEPAIVADNDDPERQHRIRVVIPSIDEDYMHDEWVRRLVLFTGAPGYGDFHVPELGSEVALFGAKGQKYSLFYASVFNEDFVIPPDFQNTGTRGVRNDGDYILSTEGDLFLRGGRVIIESDSSVRITAPAGFFVNGKKVA